jgi:hypothetical protein
VKTVAAAGLLKLRPLDFGGLARMQPHHLARKAAVGARLLGLVLAGQLIPSFRRLGLIRSALLGRRDFLGNFLGARSRASQGGNREAAPQRIDTTGPNL